MVINLLSQENSCIKQSDKRQDVSALLKFQSSAPPTSEHQLVYRNSHKPQSSYNHINPVCEEESSNYYKQKIQISNSSGHAQQNVPFSTGSKNSNDIKLQEIMLKNIWEIENNPVFCLGGSNGPTFPSDGQVPQGETLSNYDLPMQFKSPEHQPQLQYADLASSEEDDHYPQVIDDLSQH
jgi:hypothetical protein